VQARLALAGAIRGVISQRLLPRADGKGMVPAVEIMVYTERIRELIEDPHRTREIKDAIASGRHPYGMQTFDQSLAELVQRKLVTYEEALKNSSNPGDFALLFSGVSGGGGDDWTQEQVAKAAGKTAGRQSSDYDIDRFAK
jgi:twitching motility protein PilT